MNGMWMEYRSNLNGIQIEHRSNMNYDSYAALASEDLKGFATVTFTYLQMRQLVDKAHAVEGLVSRLL